MARSNNNLKAVLTDTADAIRAKKGTSEPIIPRDFADEIENLPSGGGDDMLRLLTNDLQDYVLPSILGQGSHELRRGAFAYADDLVTMDFNNEDEVPQDCCVGCTRLISAKGDNVEVIRGRAFSGCTNLQYASFPECVIFVGTSHFGNAKSLAFAHFPKLEYVAFYEPGDGTIPNGIFQQCPLTSGGGFPKLEIVKGSNTFASAFSGQESVSFPNLLEIAAQSCFNSCSFSYISVPKLLRITNTYAFMYCTNLLEFSAPYAQLNGAGSEFAICTKLSKVNLKYNTVWSPNTFSACRNLETVEGVIYAANIPNMFVGCSKLQSVSLDGYSLGYSVFSGCSMLESVYIMQKSIPYMQHSNVFSNTPMLTSSVLGHYGSIYVPSDWVASFKASTQWVTFSDRITAIPSEIESKCIFGYEYYNRYSDITEIPSEKANVECVFTRAFFQCSMLSDISLSKCEMLREGAFASCKAVNSIYLPECVAIAGGALANTFPNNGIYEMPKLKYAGANNFTRDNQQTFTVSSFTMNFPELELTGQSCFKSVPFVTSISLPKLKIVERECLCSMSGLTSLELPECVEVLSSALSYLTNVETMSFPKAIYFETNFNMCAKMTTLSVPNARFFYGVNNCSKLTELILPNVLLFSASASIYACNSLSRIVAPKAENFLPIDGCGITKLHTIKPTSLPAVRNCNSLSVALLENIDMLGRSNAICFSDCHSLMSVYLPHHHIVDFGNSSAPNNFYSTPMTNSTYTGNYGSIYVPAELLTAYKASPQWSPLSDRLVGLTDEQFQNVIDHWDD